ncbi:MAG: diguanylate cyclase [Archangiaceae bacterium]|nr:diguanylate cyclase [Archangiaceae bacterium]
MPAPQRKVALERRCLSLVETPELEQLQERVLHELADLCGAQSGALWAASEAAGLRLRAWHGLVDRKSMPERVDPTLVQNRPWHAGATFLVPLIAQGDVVGLVQLSDALSGRFPAELVTPAALLGEFAGSAIRQALKVASLQRQGLRDRDTGAYTLSYFTDYAAKEIYKARRYARTFSVLTFSIDNLPQVRLRLGNEAARAAQRSTLRAMASIIRDSDVVARATDTEFHALLPETDFFGALMFLRRALQAMRDEPEARQLEQKVPFGVTGGASTFPRDGDDFDELLTRCKGRMNERRQSLHQKLKLEGLSFWDDVELLLGNSKSPRLPETQGEPSRRGRVADVLFDELQTEVARNLLREPNARGLIYVGVPQLDVDVPIAMGLEGVDPSMGSRVYLLGRRGDLTTHPVITPVFVEGDDRLQRHEFLLWLGDGSAYALLQRRGRGATWGFHSSDPTLVEGLVSALQTEYSLQPY